MAIHYDGAATTATTDQHFVPEIWGEGIYRFFERKSIFRNLVEDYSAVFGSAGFGDVLHIPQIDIITAGDKGVGADVTYDATVTTETQLTINKHKYVAKLFEDVLEIQSNADMVAKYSRMMGESIARAVDADIWGELDGLNQTIDLSADNVLTADKFEAALANLGENDVPYMDGDCAMVVNPTLYADILNPSGGLAQYFIRNDASGEGSGLRSGLVGSLYGIEVYMSNTVSSDGADDTVAGAIFHKSAAAIAVQNDVRVQSEYSIDALGTKVVSDMLYGVKLIDSASNIKGVAFLNI